jgi:ribosomal subunit interface protein
MQIDLHAPHMKVTDKIQATVEEAFTRAVRAHTRYVASVSVHLEDINAQKGGIDKKCKVVSQMAHGGHTLVVEEIGDEILATIRAASHRFEQALHKEVDRHNDRKHRS